jgi:hypothetical protein
MKPSTTRRPGPARLSQGTDKTRNYLKFQVDPATLHQIEMLARKTGCTPFQMSVILLQEGISKSASVSAV